MKNLRDIQAIASTVLDSTLIDFFHFNEDVTAIRRHRAFRRPRQSASYNRLAATLWAMDRNGQPTRVKFRPVAPHVGFHATVTYAEEE